MSTQTSRAKIKIVVHKNFLESGWKQYEGEAEIGADSVPPDVVTWRGETYVRFRFTTPLTEKPKFKYTAEYRPCIDEAIALPDDWAGRWRD